MHRKSSQYDQDVQQPDRISPVGQLQQSFSQIYLPTSKQSEEQKPLNSHRIVMKAQNNSMSQVTTNRVYQTSKDRAEQKHLVQELKKKDLTIKQLQYENDKMYKELNKPQILNQYSDICIEFSQEILNIIQANIPAKYAFSFTAQLYENDVQSVQKCYHQDLRNLSQVLVANNNKMTQYKEQIERMRQNMDLFRENIKLLKEQNHELQKKGQLNQLFTELRQDNESMAQELKRLETINKALRAKLVKYKQKIIQSDAVILGLNQVVENFGKKDLLTTSQILKQSLKPNFTKTQSQKLLNDPLSNYLQNGKIQNHSPKTARFQPELKFQTSKLPRAQSTSGTGHQKMQNMKNDRNLSQLSRENIQKNTKVLKDEIKGVDDEIAFLQDSLINDLMQGTRQENSPSRASTNEVFTLDGPRAYTSQDIVGLSTIKNNFSHDLSMAYGNSFDVHMKIQENQQY